MKSHVAFGGLRMTVVLLLAGFVGACAGPQPDPEVRSRAKEVLDAQYAARGKPQPMQASEADEIYENYLESIGEPLEGDGAIND